MLLASLEGNSDAESDEDGTAEIVEQGSDPRPLEHGSTASRRKRIAGEPNEAERVEQRSVSEATRVRVLQASDDLDYRPHRTARALASGTSRTIALFLPSAQWRLIPVQQRSSRERP